MNFDDFKNHIIKHPRKKEYKVTSEAFDAEALLKIFQEKDVDDMPLEDVGKIVSFIEVSQQLHSSYKELYRFLEDKYKSLNIDGDEIAEYIIAGLNREAIVIKKKYIENLLKQGEGTYMLEDMANFKMEAGDGSGRKIDARAALEAFVESGNLILNHLRFFSGHHFESDASDRDFAKTVRLLLQYTPFPVILKHEYDEILYNHGFVVIDKENSEVMFDYDNHEHLKLRRAGDMMFLERKTQTGNKLRYTEAPFALDKYNKHYRLKKATVSDGVFAFSIAGANSKEYIGTLRELQSALDAFYEYLDLDIVLPLFSNATIGDCLGMLAALQYICLAMSDTNIEKDLFTREDMGIVPVKVNTHILKETLSRLTGISRRKIDAILNSLCAEKGKFNDIWTRPILERDEFCLIPLHPIIHCSPYNLIDCFLKNGGFNLDARGKIFEKYLSSKLLEKNPLSLNVLSSKDYRVGDINEEIDLIVVSQNTVFVVEAKCVHYSMDPINYHEAWERLSDGCSQATRKAYFLKSNPQLLGFTQDDVIDVIPMVVTNYPIFTGECHDDTYVIDSHSFLSYFNSGMMTVRAMGLKSDEIMAVRHFYTDEKSMRNNFRKYLSENPVKKEMLKKIDIKDHLFFESDSGWTWKSKAALVSNNPIFDIANG